MRTHTPSWANDFKTMQFPPEEFTPFILASKSEFSYDLLPFVKTLKIASPFQKSAYGPDPCITGVTINREIGCLQNSEVNKQRRDILGSVCSFIFIFIFTVKAPSDTTGAV